MTRKRNIVITGFMGTGKTTVGLVVSKRLKMDFHDTDDMIERESGLTISRIFDEYGEDYFRNLERKVIEDLASRNYIVIATGGGTLLEKHNRDLISRNGMIVCLVSRPEIIAARLAKDNDRPLLAHGKTIGNINELLKKREKAYLELPNHIDTSDKSSANVAREIIELYQKVTEYSSGGTT
jgi:shikimate kinase